MAQELRVCYWKKILGGGVILIASGSGECYQMTAFSGKSVTHCGNHRAKITNMRWNNNDSGSSLSAIISPRWRNTGQTDKRLESQFGVFINGCCYSVPKSCWREKIGFGVSFHLTRFCIIQTVWKNGTVYINLIYRRSFRRPAVKVESGGNAMDSTFRKLSCGGEPAPNLSRSIKSRILFRRWPTIDGSGCEDYRLVTDQLFQARPRKIFHSVIYFKCWSLCVRHSRNQRASARSSGSAVLNSLVQLEAERIFAQSFTSNTDALWWSICYPVGAPQQLAYAEDHGKWCLKRISRLPNCSVSR